MAEFYFTILGAILNVALPWLITRYDRKRLSPDQLARAWNGPSWACAIYFFGPLSLPAHFWVTRRTVAALLQGAAWTFAVLGSEYVVGLGLDRVLGDS